MGRDRYAHGSGARHFIPFLGVPSSRYCCEFSFRNRQDPIFQYFYGGVLMQIRLEITGLSILTDSPAISLSFLGAQG